MRVTEEDDEHTALLGDARHNDDRRHGEMPSLSTVSLLKDIPTVVDKYYVAYWIFFLLGIGMLFPWNVFITAVNFYKFRFAGSPFSDNFTNWFGLAFNLANIAGLTVLLLIAHRISIRRRVYTGLWLGLGIFVFTTAMIYVSSIAANAYFAMTLVCIVVCGIVTALLQNGVFGLSSKFPATYTASIMTGQSLAGAVVSVAQILTTLVKDPDDELNPASEQLAALLYFLVAVVILALCVVGFITLTKLPFYHFYHALKDDNVSDPVLKGDTNLREDESMDESGSGFVAPVNGISSRLEVTYWSVTKQVLSLGFSVFYVFVVTLALFPSIVAAVESTTQSSSRIFKDIFVPFAFLLFNLGDVIGRSLADWFQVIPPRFLWVASLARSIYFPLMLLSNVKLYNGSDPIDLALPALITADWAWWLIVLTFGISSGYIASLAMMYGPKQVTAIEAEKTGIVMVNFLVWGLFGGSMTSFLLRGILCSCNPFMS